MKDKFSGKAGVEKKKKKKSYELKKSGPEKKTPSSPRGRH